MAHYGEIMTKPHLVSFDLCPYVQRSVATLEEKGVEYDITYIDLANKPDWFLEISPMGKVPVLRMGDIALCESSVIAEYLDEAFGLSLHPEDVLIKAHRRAWMSYVSGLGAAGYMLMTVGNEAAAHKAADQANDKLARIEEQVVGPFWGGVCFELIDACSASFLQRLLWADARAPQLGLFKDAPKCRAWAEALVVHPSVVASLKPDIESIFDAYLADKGAWLGTQTA